MPLILSSSINLTGAVSAPSIIIQNGGGNIVSSSQQIQNYNTFAVTSSASTTFYGNVTASGNLQANQLYIGGATTSTGLIGASEAVVQNELGIQYGNATGTYMRLIANGANSNTAIQVGAFTGANPSLDLIAAGGSTAVSIKSDAGVNFGGAVTASVFSVAAAGASGIIMNADSLDSNNSGRIFFARTGGSGWGMFNNATGLSFRTGSIPNSTSGAEVIRFEESGNLTLQKGNLVMGIAGNGIDFSATSNGSGTMTSELLNDYEEGTWTPTIRGANTAGTYELTHVSHYTKIGRQVTVTSRINMAGSITGGGVGYMQIQGLPFTKLENSYAIGACDVIGCDTTGNYLTVQFISLGAGSTLFLSETNDNAASTDFPISGLSASDSIGIGITYFV